MSLSARLVAAGLSPIQALAINGTAADNLTATGTTQATAFPIPADVCRFTTVALNSGCQLPPVNPGDCGTIRNDGANPLAVYPQLGGKINGLGANASYAMAANTAADWYATSAGQIIISSST